MSLIWLSPHFSTRKKNTLIFQENQTEIEGLREKVAKLEGEKEQARITKSKLKKKKEDKVRSDHLAMDATRASQKTNLCASKL